MSFKFQLQVLFYYFYFVFISFASFLVFFLPAYFFKCIFVSLNMLTISLFCFVLFLSFACWFLVSEVFVGLISDVCYLCWFLFLVLSFLEHLVIDFFVFFFRWGAQFSLNFFGGNFLRPGTKVDSPERICFCCCQVLE